MSQFLCNFHINKIGSVYEVYTLTHYIFVDLKTWWQFKQFFLHWYKINVKYCIDFYFQNSLTWQNFIILHRTIFILFYLCIFHWIKLVNTSLYNKYYRNSAPGNGSIAYLKTSRPERIITKPTFKPHRSKSSNWRSEDSTDVR